MCLPAFSQNIKCLEIHNMASPPYIIPRQSMHLAKVNIRCQTSSLSKRPEVIFWLIFQLWTEEIGIMRFISYLNGLKKTHNEHT